MNNQQQRDRNDVKQIMEIQNDTNNYNSLQYYTLIEILGYGTQATIFLVQHKYDMKKYILRVMPKDIIVQSNIMMNQVKTEAKIIDLVKGQFVQKYVTRFQNSNYLIMVMQYIEGITLREMIAANQTLDMRQTKLVCAQLLLCMEELHSKKVLLKDIRLENFIVGRSDGYLTLIDYGSAVIADQNGMVPGAEMYGVITYFSPEQVQKQNYSYEADYWSLGVLICELLTGQNPFAHDDPFEMLRNIQVREVDLDDYLGNDCKDFVKMCLVKSPKLRIGYKGQIQQLFKHGWFKEVDFDAIRKKKLNLAQFTKLLPRKRSDLGCMENPHKISLENFQMNAKNKNIEYASEFLEFQIDSFLQKEKRERSRKRLHDINIDYIADMDGSDC